MKSFLALYVAVTLAGQASLAAPEELPAFHYHPEINWVIGQGVDLRFPGRSVFTCVQPKGGRSLVEQDRPTASQSAPLDLQVVTSRSEYKSLVGMDTTFSARKLVASIKAELHASIESRLERDSVALVLQHSAKFMPERLVRGFEFVEEIKSLVANRDWHAFREQCGDAVVSQVKKELGVRVVILITGYTREQKNKIKASFEGSGNVLLAKAKLKTEIFANWSSLESERRIDVKAMTFGGDGIPDDAELIASIVQPTVSLEAIGKALAAKASKLTANLAAGTEYKLVRYPGVPGSESIDSWTEEERDRLLTRLVDQFHKRRDRLDLVEGILARRNAVGLIPDLPQFMRSSLKIAAQESEDERDLIRQIALTHEACLKAAGDQLRSACRVPESEFEGARFYDMIGGTL